MVHWEEHRTWDILAQNAYSQSNHDKPSEKPKLRDILQNTWPIFFRNITSFERQGKTKKPSQTEKDWKWCNN